MLCFPGFTPVANDAQAVGDSGECVVPSADMPPRPAILAMLGRLPHRHPSRDEMRMEAIDPEDDELLSELSGWPAAAARDERAARERERHRECRDSRSACLHRDGNYCNRPVVALGDNTGW